MKEEIEKVIDEWAKEIDNLKTDVPDSTLNNKLNKPYHDLEKKYKDKMQKIKEKYSTQK